MRKSKKANRTTFKVIVGGFLFSILLLAVNFSLLSQEKPVKSTAFRILLNGMLKHDVQEITVDSLKDVLKTATPKFLDAREKNEYNVSHLKGATWIGYDDFSLERVQNFSKDDTLFVYCSIGKRSEDITRKLTENGFKNAYNLYGGIFEWVNQDGEVFNQGMPTKNVHGFSKVWSVWLKKGNTVY